MRRYTLAVTLAAAATVLVTGVAAADTPVAGDDRATAHAGNVVAQDCAELVPGSHEIEPAFSVDDTNTYLDVTGEVAAVVVKGGPAYNVYPAAGEDLHAPLVPSGEPAEISHWFACGVEETVTSTTDTTAPTTSVSSSAESVTTTATTTTTTPVGVAPAAAEEELAATGVDSGWLVVLATVLLAGGGALLLLGRRATRR